MRGVMLCMLAFFCGCVMPSFPQGKLGFSEERRVVIAGENVREDLAQYYEKKYEARVLYSPFEGKVANAANNLLESGIGPSRDKRALIAELRSMNHTIGRWELIVPKIAEGYFLSALKYMENGELSKARGMVVLIDSESSPDLEQEVERVTEGSFFVNYEFRKDLE